MLLGLSAPGSASAGVKTQSNKARTIIFLLIAWRRLQKVRNGLATVAAERPKE